MTYSYPVSAADAFHLDVPNDHVGSLWMLTGRVEAAVVAEAARAAIKAVPKLRMRLEGTKCWAEYPEARAEDQIVWCPVSGDTAEMLARLAEVYLRPLVSERLPPWRVVHLPMSDRSGDRIAFLAHHAFVDGTRGLALARAFANAKPIPAVPPAAGISFREVPGSMSLLVKGAALDLKRGRTMGVDKGEDSGKRQFELAVISAMPTREARHASSTGIAPLLGGALAAAIAERYGAEAVSLMIPRFASAGSGANNGFIPEVWRFDNIGRVSAAPPVAHPRKMAAVERIRLRALRWMPPLMRDTAYHTWADGFDALCTILAVPGRRMELMGQEVVKIAGIPPLVWRQPLSAAFVYTQLVTTILIAWDPGTIDAAGMAQATADRIGACPG